jgi:hypothetical protein
MDIYHWGKDEQAAAQANVPVIDEKIKQKVDAFLDDPKLKSIKRKYVSTALKNLRYLATTDS